MEGRSGGDSPVQRPVEAFGAHLPGEVNGEGLGHRHHSLLRPDNRWVADVVDGMKGKAGIVVHQVVEAPRAHRPARRDRAGDDAGGDEIDDRLSDDVRMDGQVAPPCQVSQHPVRHSAEVHVKRGPIVDQPRGVASDLLGHLADGVVEILHHRRLDRHETCDAIDRDTAVACGARHRRVDFGDDRSCGQRRRLGHVNRYPQAAGPVRFGWRDLHHRDVEGDLPGLEQPGNIHERERHVVHETRLAQGTDVVQGADVPPDVEHAMPIVRMRRVTRAHPVGKEMHEDNSGPPDLLQGIDQSPRSGAGAADENLVPRAHHRDRLRGRNLAVTPVDCHLGTHPEVKGYPRASPPP